MKKSKIKLVKGQTIIYDKDSNFITDGNFAINADYAELSSEGLQDLINKKQPFNCRNYKESDSYIVLDTPQVSAIIPKKHPEVEFVPSRISVGHGRKEQATILYGLKNNKIITCVNSTYLKYFQEIARQNLTVKYYQKDPLGAVVITCGPDIIGLVMPIQLKYDHELWKILNAYAQDYVQAATEH